MEQYLYWLIGFIGIPLVNWLKVLLKLEGKLAMVLTAAVAFVLAVISLFIANMWTGVDFTWEAIPSIFAQVLTTATLAYKLLSKQE